MNNQIAEPPVAILLSREELLAVLDALEANTIPGLDEDPLGDMTPEGRQLAVTVARRALQARELGRVEDDGTFLLHRALLTAVGVCAYSQSAILAFHWPAGSDEATRFFGHIRDGDAVMHTRPADVSPPFRAARVTRSLIQKLLDFCEAQDRAAGETATNGQKPLAAVEFKIKQQDFARARDLGGQARWPTPRKLCARPEPRRTRRRLWPRIVSCWAKCFRGSGPQASGKSRHDSRVNSRSFRMHRARLVAGAGWRTGRRGSGRAVNHQGTGIVGAGGVAVNPPEASGSQRARNAPKNSKERKAHAEFVRGVACLWASATQH